MKQTFKLITTLVSLLLLSSVITITPVVSNTATSPPINIQASNTWLKEWIWTEITDDGYIYGNVNLESNAMHLEVAGLGALGAVSAFNRVDIWTTEADNPWDKNLEFTFVFQTNQPSDAELFANIIISALGSNVLIDSLEFTGSYGFDDNLGDGWKPYTRVTYQAHVDWTGFLDIINGVIPRELGGISESIDVYQADSLKFNMWLNGDEIITSVGLEYHSDVPTQSGGFSISLKSLIPVSTFKVSPYSDGLYIHHNIPDVTNLAYSLTNTTDTNVHISYEPSSEPQNNIAYFIDTDMHGSASYSDITLNFDYEFTQWSWINREHVNWKVDTRGYSYVNIDINGKDRATFSSDLPINSSLFDDTIEVALDIEPMNIIIPGHDTQWLHVTFPQGTDFAFANSTTQAIATAISNALGIEFTNSWNGSDSWGNGDWTIWDPVTQSEIPVEVIYYAGRSMNESTFQSMLTNSYVYGKSAVMQASDLTAIQSAGWRVWDDKWGKGGEISLRIDPLQRTLITPLTPFPQLTNNQITVDLLDPIYLDWQGVLPWNAYSEKLELNFESYYDGPFEQLTFNPDYNNGWAWDSGRWTQYGQFPGFNYWVNIYDANPQILDDNGNNIGSLTSLQLTYDSYYYDLSSDLENPWLIEGWYESSEFNNELDGYTNYHRMWNGLTLNGTANITAEVSDESWMEYWDGTTWQKRVPSSGIYNVTGQLFRTDAPVDNPLFTKNITFTHNPTWINDAPTQQVWDSSIDTWQLPDGEWNIWFTFFDNNGNKGSDQRTFTVDNYNESYQPAEITWDASAPANNSGVSDITWFNFTVTDDVGIFSVVAWNNLGGYILDSVSTTGNTSTYAFKVDTLVQGLPENAYMAITIEVLDMDGHWSYQTLHVYIDNLHPGNPPTANLIAPANGMTINNSMMSTLLFQASVTDDWGIQDVKINFAGAQSMTFDMFYNEATGYYEFSADISSWALGDYTWSVTVTDIDENQHTVTSGSLSFTIVGEAPTSDTTNPVVTLLSPSDGDTVSGDVAITVQVTDNVAVQQVSITLPDGKVESMTSSGANTYEYTWDSASVIDGSVTLTITGRDTAGNTKDLSFTLVTSNGRTASTPDLGLPGFSFFTSLSLLGTAVIFIRKRK